MCQVFSKPQELKNKGTHVKNPFIEEWESCRPGLEIWPAPLKPKPTRRAKGMRLPDREIYTVSSTSEELASPQHARDKMICARLLKQCPWKAQAYWSEVSQRMPEGNKQGHTAWVILQCFSCCKRAASCSGMCDAVCMPLPNEQYQWWSFNTCQLLHRSGFRKPTEKVAIRLCSPWQSHQVPGRHAWEDLGAFGYSWIPGGCQEDCAGHWSLPPLARVLSCGDKDAIPSGQQAMAWHSELQVRAFAESPGIYCAWQRYSGQHLIWAMHKKFRLDLCDQKFGCKLPTPCRLSVNVLRCSDITFNYSITCHTASIIHHLHKKWP